MMDAKQLMWDVGCGEPTGDFYVVTPAQLENIIAKVRADALAQQGEQQPVYWEWRVLDTHPQTVTSGQWSDWKRVEPRNPNIGTVQDALAEIQYYIDQGHKYELRALYTAAPAPQQDKP